MYANYYYSPAVNARRFSDRVGILFWEGTNYAVNFLSCPDRKLTA